MNKKNSVLELEERPSASLILECYGIESRVDIPGLVVTPKKVMESGNPKEAICDAVEKLGVDLLIVGSNGKGALERTFLGSVSNYCVNKAKCPVLVVLDDIFSYLLECLLQLHPCMPSHRLLEFLRMHSCRRKQLEVSLSPVPMHFDGVPSFVRSKTHMKSRASVKLSDDKKREEHMNKMKMKNLSDFTDDGVTFNSPAMDARCCIKKPRSDDHHHYMSSLENESRV
ncbi:unnamed protein product [Thlaspi arvense]|uniref:UspA domain-containing protein n=1 Tax=Thlaspi arvense TaxID=13288 RepID=A0AAU9SH90_THLAR|nr:unnamed protein product [Thlaspi arvense]